jgi:hypothetical protein
MYMYICAVCVCVYMYVEYGQLPCAITARCSHAICVFPGHTGGRGGLLAARVPGSDTLNNILYNNRILLSLVFFVVFAVIFSPFLLLLPPLTDCNPCHNRTAAFSLTVVFWVMTQCSLVQELSTFRSNILPASYESVIDKDVGFVGYLTQLYEPWELRTVRADSADCLLPSRTGVAVNVRDMFGRFATTGYPQVLRGFRQFLQENSEILTC